MKKLHLPHHVTRKARGKTYEYFERNGDRIRLPAIDDPGFLDAYNRAKKHGPTIATKGKTWADLIAHYKRTPKFAALAPRTRSDYDKALTYIENSWGKLDVRRSKRKDVEAIMFHNRDAGRTRFANSIKSTLSILFEEAKRQEWMTANPAQLVDPLPASGEPGKPWPPAALTAYEKHANPRARLVMELCIGTAQRIGDVLKMKWSEIDDGGIWVTQNKTKVKLFIPFTARLEAYLATVKKEGFTIVADQHGRPVSYNAVSHAIMQARKDSGATAYTIHGWRYTAIEQLAEAECTDEDIEAISGHASRSMIKKYSGPARQRARARRAQRKRD